MKTHSSTLPANISVLSFITKISYLLYQKLAVNSNLDSKVVNCILIDSTAYSVWRKGCRLSWFRVWVLLRYPLLLAGGKTFWNVCMWCFTSCFSWKWAKPLFLLPTTLCLMMTIFNIMQLAVFYISPCSMFDQIICRAFALCKSVCTWHFLSFRCPGNSNRALKQRD